jgi:hypothetical protein
MRISFWNMVLYTKPFNVTYLSSPHIHLYVQHSYAVQHQYCLLLCTGSLSQGLLLTILLDLTDQAISLVVIQPLL